jgi:histidine ammonia-lyase
MSMSAGLKAARAADLARHAIACELLCACAAIDLLAPLRSSAPLMRAHDFIRQRVPPLEHDRSLSPDLRVISDMIVSGTLERSCGVDVN